MKFTCQTESLKDALHLLKIQSDKSTNVSIHALKQELQLKSYVDNETMSIEYTIPAEVDEPGTTTVFSEPLEQICEYTHDETLSFSLHKWHSRLDIEGTEHQHSLKCHRENPPYYSHLIEESEAPWYNFNATHFRQGLKSVLFVVPPEKERERPNLLERPALYGVLFHRHEEQDRMVATDGRRMAVYNLASSAQPAGTAGDFPMRPMLYPACVKFVDVIESLNPQTCRLRFGEPHLSFECEGVSLRCLWPKGDSPEYPDFPDYLAILPDPKPPLRVRVNRETLIWALEIIRATPGHPSGRTEFCAESGQMTLENKDNHGTIGRSRVQIPAQYDGLATSATFQAQYIEEALRQTDATEVTFCFRQPEERNQSMILELEDGFDYLVMPMR